MPSQRLSRELSLANGVAAVAGFEAGVPQRLVPSISNTQWISSNGQSDTTTPLHPTIPVDEEESQAVCKLRSSNSLIFIF